MLSDFRYAFRLLRHRPAFTAAVVLTLAVGIGAATAVFSIVDRVLLEPLPFRDPDRIVAVRVRNRTGEYGIAGGVMRVLRELPVIEHAAAMIGTEQNLVNGADLTIARGAMVTGEFFDVFNAAPLVGRTLDTGAGQDALSEVVIGERLWRERFAADPAVIGRNIRLDDRLFTIVGVMPRSVDQPDDARYWRRMNLTGEQLAALGIGPFNAVARVSSSGLTQARAAADALSASLPPSSEAGSATIALTPLLDTMTDEYRRVLWLVMGAVVLVLTIACGNVAHLLLARNTRRQQELAVRHAIGATRLRLTRQLITEAAVLAVPSAVAGLAIATLLIRVVPAIGVTIIPRIDEIQMNGRVALFAIAASTASVLLFGLVPSWLSAGGGPVRSGHGTAAPATKRAASALVVTEIALTVLLVLGGVSGTLSLVRMLWADVGFDASSVAIATLRPSVNDYAGGDRGVFYQQVVNQLREMPGIDGVAGVSHVPLGPYLAERTTITTADGRSASDGRRGPGVRTIAPGSLTALRASFISGRDFSAGDRDGSPPVAIVNAALANRLWPGLDAIGQTVLAPSLVRDGAKSYTVIGVVRDFRGSLSIAAQPEMYVSVLQRPLQSMHLMLRTRLPQASVESHLKAALAAVDPRQPAGELTSLKAMVWRVTEYNRFRASLLAAFALLALVLAGSGVLGVVIHSVTARTRELGVRAALGALPRQLIALVLRDLLLPVGLGCAGGVAAYYLLSTTARHIVAVERLGVEAGAAAVLIVMTIAAIAAWVPARYAGRVDPIQALRAE